jgi:hypothetical protein
VKSGFRYGDTWYPAWAGNDILYSPWTDGKTKRLDGYTDWSQSWVHPEHITTGQGVILGDDPLNLIAYSIGLDKSSPAAPYPGRYPCGSLIHNGVWYYGTYCLGPGDGVHYGKTRLNWPWIGPFVGFRHLHRLRPQLDAATPHAGETALRRIGDVGLPGQDRRAEIRRFRQEHGTFARRQGLSGGAWRGSRDNQPKTGGCGTTVGSPATRSICCGSRPASRPSTIRPPMSSTAAKTCAANRSGPTTSKNQTPARMGQQHGLRHRHLQPGAQKISSCASPTAATRSRG